MHAILNQRRAERGRRIRDTQIEQCMPFLIIGVLNGVKAFAAKFETMEFNDIAFPDQLKKRGFDRKEEVDGVKGYFFRDDGFQMWDALLK